MKFVRNARAGGNAPIGCMRICNRMWSIKLRIMCCLVCVHFVVAFVFVQWPFFLGELGGGKALKTGFGHFDFRECRKFAQPARSDTKNQLNLFNNQFGRKSDKNRLKLHSVRRSRQKSPQNFSLLLIDVMSAFFVRPQMTTHTILVFKSKLSARKKPPATLTECCQLRARQ